jgi:hypothetical protein
MPPKRSLGQIPEAPPLFSDTQPPIFTSEMGGFLASRAPIKPRRLATGTTGSRKSLFRRYLGNSKRFILAKCK